MERDGGKGMGKGWERDGKGEEREREGRKRERRGGSMPPRSTGPGYGPVDLFSTTILLPHTLSCDAAAVIC